MPVFHVNPSGDFAAPFAAVGGPLVAFHIEDQAYWHEELDLLFASDDVLKVTSEGRCPSADWPQLECFTPVIERCTRSANAMTRIEPAFHIVEISLLRREEWLVAAPEIAPKTVGTNPHLLMSGIPGSDRANAVAAAVVVSGFMLTSYDGRRNAVVTSERVPMNIDFIQDPEMVSELLCRHSVETVWQATNTR